MRKKIVCKCGKIMNTCSSRKSYKDCTRICYKCYIEEANERLAYKISNIKDYDDRNCLPGISPLKNNNMSSEGFNFYKRQPILLRGEKDFLYKKYQNYDKVKSLQKHLIFSEVNKQIKRKEEVKHEKETKEKVIEQNKRFIDGLINNARKE